MRTATLLSTVLAASALAACAPSARAQAQAPGDVPVVSVDLATEPGARLLGADWRYADATLVRVPFRAPGADSRPSGPPNETWDVSPHAGATELDDSGWQRVGADTLHERRGNGRVSFAWYRTALTVPERIGGVATRGATLSLEVVVDDYAEVWVDGSLPRELGQSGGSLIAGFNAKNRVVLTRDARPGQRIRVAIFAINGPISDPPANYIWIRSARVDVATAPRAVAPRPVATTLERLDPALDAIVAPGASVEQVAEGFQFTEGPVWAGDRLLFSDPNANTIYAWSEAHGLSVFRPLSGYEGADVAAYGQPGSNGLALDAQGRLTACEHGNRRVTRTERDGTRTVLADSWAGMRLNSPNDLVYKSDGSLWFTDPPFGLPRAYEDPRKELPFCGVYRWADGKLTLVAKTLLGPNGIAFSPDERFLYVANWDVARKVVMRHEVRADGTLADGETFFDMTAAKGEEALDGLEVDRDGNLFVSGPGGVWILSAAGKHLGTLRFAELPANFAWGDDGKTLYLTARGGLYRLRMLVPGAGAFWPRRDR